MRSNILVQYQWRIRVWESWNGNSNISSVAVVLLCCSFGLISFVQFISNFSSLVWIVLNYYYYYDRCKKKKKLEDEFEDCSMLEYIPRARGIIVVSDFICLSLDGLIMIFECVVVVGIYSLIDLWCSKRIRLRVHGHFILEKILNRWWFHGHFKIEQIPDLCWFQLCPRKYYYSSILWKHSRNQRRKNSAWGI